jgi:hypothetical protein
LYRKILIYGLPIYLWALELFVRTIGHLPGDSVAGPSLASAGIGFLLPLTKLKPVLIDPALLAKLQGRNVQIYSPKDASFSDLVLLIFILSLGAWMYSIYDTVHSQRRWPFVNVSLLIGCIIFVVSIVCSEVKERI